jgi:hypothetical protein
MTPLYRHGSRTGAGVWGWRLGNGNSPGEGRQGLGERQQPRGGTAGVGGLGNYTPGMGWYRAQRNAAASSRCARASSAAWTTQRSMLSWRSGNPRNLRGSVETHSGRCWRTGSRGTRSMPRGRTCGHSASASATSDGTSCCGPSRRSARTSARDTAGRAHESAYGTTRTPWAQRAKRASGTGASRMPWPQAPPTRAQLSSPGSGACCSG